MLLLGSGGVNAPEKCPGPLNIFQNLFYKLKYLTLWTFQFSIRMSIEKLSTFQCWLTWKEQRHLWGHEANRAMLTRIVCPENWTKAETYFQHLERWGLLAVLFWISFSGTFLSNISLTVWLNPTKIMISLQVNAEWSEEKIFVPRS